MADHSPSDDLDRLAGSVSDGMRVDWDRVESEPRLADTTNALKDLERIAEFSRALQRTRSVGPGASATQTGERWGDLLLLELIGAGAKGEVWRAWDSVLQREVALKFLQATPSTREGGSQAELLSEARALARVRHRGVVAVYGIAEHGGRAGMWMECLQGSTLAREVERLGALPAERVAHIGLQLCAALEELESKGLVHRDIKPANTVLEGDRVVLTDFGLGWRPAVESMDASRVSGTPMFMAPELLAGGTASARSDLYALGVTLWWSLAGKAPFHAGSFHELKEEAARGPRETLAVTRPGAPQALVQAIEWAMRPGAGDRPATAAALSGALRSALDEIGAAGRPAGAPRDAGPRSPAVASIAVLPFANRSAGAEDEYFSDGLADELLNVLAKIRGLRVAARTSSFSFKGKAVTAGEIGRALNVACLLEGSVRKSGERVRISVQLVNVSDGYHLWSESYDRKLVDIFDVQDDIARSVVRELRSTLLGEPEGAAQGIGIETKALAAEVAKAAAGRSSNPEAHRLYLEGRYFLEQHTASSRARGLGLLEKAVGIDPDFALGWAEVGRGYTLQAANDGIANGYELGRTAVQRALSLEPALAEAHAVLGWIQLIHDWDRAAAERSTRRALELAPENASVLRRAAVLAWTQDRVDEAIELNRRSTNQDPLDHIPYLNLGLALQAAGRLDEAEGAYRKALDLVPGMVGLHAYLATTLAQQGRTEEALAEAALEADEPHRLQGQALIYQTFGLAVELERTLSQLAEKHADRMPFEIAEIHALRGDADQAFAWLERAFGVRTVMVCDVKVSRRLLSLHGDPRWQNVLRRAGVVPVATGGGGP